MAGHACGVKRPLAFLERGKGAIVTALLPDCILSLMAFRTCFGGHISGGLRVCRAPGRDSRRLLLRHPVLDFIDLSACSLRHGRHLRLVGNHFIQFDITVRKLFDRTLGVGLEAKLTQMLGLIGSVNNECVVDLLRIRNQATPVSCDDDVEIFILKRQLVGGRQLEIA